MDQGVKASKAPPVETPAKDDPTVEELIENAVAPYHGLVAPEVIAEMREILGMFLTTHPVAAPMVDRLRPRPVMSESGSVARGGETAETTEALAPSGTEGKPR